MGAAFFATGKGRRTDSPAVKQGMQVRFCGQEVRPSLFLREEGGARISCARRDVAPGDVPKKSAAGRIDGSESEKTHQCANGLNPKMVGRASLRRTTGREHKRKAYSPQGLPQKNHNRPDAPICSWLPRHKNVSTRFVLLCKMTLTTTGANATGKGTRLHRQPALAKPTVRPPS